MCADAVLHTDADRCSRFQTAIYIYTASPYTHLSKPIGRFRRGLFLLPVRTFFTMEGCDSEFAKLRVLTLKALLKARS